MQHCLGKARPTRIFDGGPWGNERSIKLPTLVAMQLISSVTKVKTFYQNGRLSTVSLGIGILLRLVPDVEAECDTHH